MHRNVSHNKCYTTCTQFANATLGFLYAKQFPGNWANLCDSVDRQFWRHQPKGISGYDVIGSWLERREHAGENFEPQIFLSRKP